MSGETIGLWTSDRNGVSDESLEVWWMAPGTLFPLLFF